MPDGDDESQIMTHDAAAGVHSEQTLKALNKFSRKITLRQI